MTSLTRAARANLPSQPWYREPWPWFLMSGPAIVVVAGIITYVLAARTENALVVDNYYKEGLAINRVLDANRSAATHHYQAHLAWSGEGALRLSLTGEGALPATLQLKFIHPTHARFDTTLPLIRNTDGVYAPALARNDAAALQEASPRWYVKLEDQAGSWRLSGEWDLRKSVALQLTAERP